MRIVLLLVCAALLTFYMGCTSSNLRPDPVIPAYAVGYPSVEFHACGNLYHGLGTCYLKTGDSLNSLSLKVQGYYKGTGRVVSEACGVDHLFSYENHQLVSVNIPEAIAKHNCLFDIVLSPEYPKQDESGLEIYPLTGLLALRVSRGEQIWRGENRKVTGNWYSILHLPFFSPDKSALVGMSGCGIKFVQNLDIAEGVLDIPLNFAVVKEPRSLCIIEGVAVLGMWDYTFTVAIAQYANALPEVLKWQGYGFLPLSEPSITISNETVHVSAEDAVSVISLNDDYVLGNAATFFNFSRGKKGVLRLVTVKGRSLVAIWDPLLQEFRWIK